MEHINLVETFSEFKEFKNIDRETMMRIIEDIFRHMLGKRFGTDENFDIIVNIDKGDLEEAKAIAKDIAGNEKKIIHHGKRADTGDRGRNTAGIYPLTTAVKHLPALRAGPVVQSTGAQAMSRGVGVLPLRRRLSCLFPVQRGCRAVPPKATGSDRRVRSEAGRREDAMHRVWAFCPSKGAAARRETKGLHLPRLSALLREDQRWVLQGQAPHQSQETGAKSAPLPRVGREGSLCTEERGNDQMGPYPRGRTSELLRHNG